MNHLITGAEEAIKSGPVIKTSKAYEYDYLFIEVMQKVLSHYQRGGTLMDRPTL